MDNLTGNLTTIINWIALLILPYVAGYGVTQDLLVALISSVIGIVFAVINSYYPNTFKFLGNKPTDSSGDIGESDSC